MPARKAHASRAANAKGVNLAVLHRGLATVIECFAIFERDGLALFVGHGESSPLHKTSKPVLDLRQNVVHEPPHVHQGLRCRGPAERRP